MMREKMQNFACISSSFHSLRSIILRMQRNWLHSKWKGSLSWASEQTKISQSLIFRNENLWRDVCAFLNVCHCDALLSERDRKFFAKNNIIFYDDDSDINLWASFRLAKWNFLMFADLKCIQKSYEGYWGQKTLAWLWEKSTRGQMEDGRVTMVRWVSLQFLLFSRVYFTCWCEKYTTFPFLSCTYSLATFRCTHCCCSLIHS